jgi:predicted MFS family arabinose efflux permease
LRRAAHSRSFVLLNAAFFVCGFHVTFIATHLVSYAGDLGVGDGPASTGLAVIGLFNIAGSLVAGYLGGRYLKSRLLSVIYGLRAVVIAAFVLVPASDATVVAFGALIGLLWLSTVPLTGGIVASQFGTTHSGTLFGVVFLSHQLGAFIGVWMGGELADRAGTYAPVWWIAVALGVFAAVLHLMIDEGPAPQPPVVATAGSAAERPVSFVSVLPAAE